MGIIIDINCDLGEEILHDGQPVEPLIMPLISSANIACGKHAGNRTAMESSIALAKEYGVSVGAHPSYNDRSGFGRNFVPMEMNALRELLLDQILLLMEVADKYDVPVVHIKPHGALYNAAAIKPEVAAAVVQAILLTGNKLMVFGLPGSMLQHEAITCGLAFAAEAFPDRAYTNNGTLASRNIQGSVIHDANSIVERTLTILKEQRVKTINSKWLEINPGTLCIHGDNPNVVKILTELRKVFHIEGIAIQPFKQAN